MQPGGARRDRARDRDVRRRFVHGRDARGDDATRERKQQYDCGQRHAAFANEEFRQSPRDGRHRQCAHPRCQRAAEPRDRGQHQHTCDHHENVVESGDQTKMLVVDRRRVLWLFLLCHIRAKRLRRFFAEDAGAYGCGQIVVAIHVSSRVQRWHAPVSREARAP